MISKNTKLESHSFVLSLVHSFIHSFVQSVAETFVEDLLLSDPTYSDFTHDVWKLKIVLLISVRKL